MKEKKDLVRFLYRINFYEANNRISFQINVNLKKFRL
jgi:hypothetical protein